jgi:hypothetical protein
VKLPKRWNFLVVIRQDRARFVHRVPVNYHAILAYKPWRFERETYCEITQLFYRYLDLTDWAQYMTEKKTYSCQCSLFRARVRGSYVWVKDVVFGLLSFLTGRELLRRA